MTQENMPQSENKVEADQTYGEAISFLDFIVLLVDNLRLLTIGPIVVGLSALGLSFTIEPTYRAKTQFLPPQQQQSSASALVQALGVGTIGGLGASLGIKNPADQHIAFLKSQSIQNAIVERFDLMKRYDAKLRVDARKTLLQKTNIASGKEGLIVLEFDDKDPKVASEIANAYVDELRRLMNRLALSEAQTRLDFFEKKVNEAKINLATAEESLRGTGVSTGVLKTSPAVAIEVVARLSAGITVQEVKVANMRGYLAETSPEFLQAIKELSVLKSQLSIAEQSDFGKGDSLYVTKFREFKYQETIYELFSKQYELAKIDESREGSSVQVVDFAEVPERKSKPQKMLIAFFSTLAAGFSLLFYILIRHTFRLRFKLSNSINKIEYLKVAWKNFFHRS